MNTLSRLEAFLCPPPPSLSSSSITHSPQSSISSSASSSLPVSEQGPALGPGPGPSSAVSTSISTSITASPSSSPAPTPPLRSRRVRRRRRPPTSNSIKLPSPATPLLLRAVLALWSMLLSFWRSLVGDTRAVRSMRQKHRRLKGAAGVLPPILDSGPPTPRIEASSDEGEGSGSEIETWSGPPTPPERPPPDATFSFRLRSAKDQDLTLTGVIDSEAEGTKRRTRLLPNPMSTSLLDPSVPAVPHRHAAPPRTPRQQTPFHLQKTLILDLDETLIHSTSRPIGAGHGGGGLLGMGSGLFGRRGRREGHTIEVVLNGRSTTYHVYKRPYVDFFLKKVASWYTLVIYTASMPEYADPVIDWLDNGRGLFAKRLYRESCFLQPNGSYIKDLALVDQDLGKVCFMDNSPISYSWNKANALPIEGWTSDPNDEALLQSIPVLDSLRFVTDVRRILGIRGFV